MEKYVEGCEVCAQKKAPHHPHSMTQPLDVPNGLWEEVGVDLITQLPQSGGYDAILVCTDLYGKQIHSIVLRETENFMVAVLRMTKDLQ